jgi:DNA replication initiation complex subunit (GINS family)
MPDAFSQLLEWRRAEASARSLSKIGPEFYASTAKYLADLRRSYEVDLRENPSGKKGEISRQTYQRASQVARDILEARAQKLLAAVFQASVGGPRDLPNALPEERTLYDHLLETLIDFRRSSAPYLEPPAVAPPAPATAPAPARPASATPPPSPSVASARPLPPAATLGAAPPAPGSVTYVRIVRTTRPLELASETVDLREDDVLSLPAEAARLLVEAKVAEALTTTPLARPR